MDYDYAKLRYKNAVIVSHSSLGQNNFGNKIPFLSTKTFYSYGKSFFTRHICQIADVLYHTVFIAKSKLILFWNQTSHSMAKANLNKSEWLVTKKLLQHQSTHLRGPKSASIEISPLRPHFINFSKTVYYEVKFTTEY